MKNTFKKALSFFLAVIMSVGMFPISVFATGSDAEYVYISISDDDKFVDTKDGEVMAYMPVDLKEVSKMNLSEYGLDMLAIDENGDG